MRTVLKWAGIALGVIVGGLLVVAVAFYLIGSSKVDRTYEVQTAALTIPSDSASLVRGAHLARIHGCADCHGEDLSGRVFLDIPPFRATAVNLTPGAGGVGQRYDAADFDRAIRHGVKPDGRPVIIMPSAAFHKMSDEDAADLIAYLQQLPPVDNELPPTEIRMPGRLMAAAVFDPAMEVRTAPARAGASPEHGPTVSYGAYLASMTCAYCHGEDLRGLEKPPIEGSPPAPDLAPAGTWPFDVFEEVVRTGTLPGGREMNLEYMPYTLTAAMDDDELRALHAYFGTLGENPAAATDDATAAR